MRKPWLDNLILESFAMNRHILLAYVCFFFARYVTDHPQAMVCHWGFLTSPENRGFLSKWNSPIVGQNSYMIYIYIYNYITLCSYIYEIIYDIHDVIYNIYIFIYLWTGWCVSMFVRCLFPRWGDGPLIDDFVGVKQPTGETCSVFPGRGLDPSCFFSG